jgi:hypothetical protein
VRLHLHLPPLRLLPPAPPLLLLLLRPLCPHLRRRATRVQANPKTLEAFIMLYDLTLFLFLFYVEFFSSNHRQRVASACVCCGCSSSWQRDVSKGV